MRNVTEYTIFDRHSLTTANFTAATTDIITSNSHGLKNGDSLVVSNSGGALPAGLATNTVYYVIEAATNTFKLSAVPIANYTTGQIASPKAVDITDTGTGTHTFVMHDIGRNIYCRDFRHAIVSVHTADSGNMTMKFVGSIGDSVASPYDCPDFSATQSKDNSWDYVMAVDYNTAIAIDGDTGFSVAGTDDQKQYRINTDGLEWINCILTAWSAGNISVRILLYND